MFKASLNHLIGYLTRCSTETTSCPEVLPSISFVNFCKFFKKYHSTSTFYPARYPTWCYCRRRRYKYVYKILTDYTSYYPKFKRLTGSPDQFFNSKGHVTFQHLITILRDPYKIILNIKYLVASISIIHKPSFQAFGLPYFE
jgi:hypothetical protein